MAYKQLTKAPGEHSAWHKNTGGLSILITEGKGYYQERGQEARLLHAGDIVEAGANIEHWIGAAPGCPMSYAVIGNPGETQETEALKEADYHAAVAESLKPLSSNTLSAREHAIVLIGASTGYGDYIALREALKAALEEGMTQNELKEILAQAYAYCGFPRAIRATQVLMGLIEERKSQGIDDPRGLTLWMSRLLNLNIAVGRKCWRSSQEWLQPRNRRDSMLSVRLLTASSWSISSAISLHAAL